jgi:hypothetical protein
MKRSWCIALLGVGLAGLSYGLLLGSRAAAVREIERTCGPELAWIKTQFQLDEPTFERVRVLHEAYKPTCAKFCRQIDDQYQELAELLSGADSVTPEITSVVAQANALRAQCQTEMLKHFIQVSQAMPPEQGRRYLAWMQEQTLSSSHASMVPQVGTGANHDGHVH